MSEALDKVLGISTLPLFPLPLVLLPNELLPLHIFEPRYRQMLIDIGSQRNLFGVSHFESNETFVDNPPVGTTGCVAEVRESNVMSDGRSNILAMGIVRYRVNEYVDAGTPYFTANVEFFEDEPEPDAAKLEAVSDEVYTVFERIAKAAFKLSGSRGQFPDIPKTEPEKLSFLVTAAFNLDNELKYELLSMTSTIPRLERLKSILFQAVDQMEGSAEIHQAAQTNGHSKKKIDLG
jgi:Lon protease-like protein